MTAIADETTTRRVDAIDMLRGLVILLMVLDHTRDFFHADAMVSSPTNPDTASAILFFTRWVTHLCAPTFVLLAGVSIYLQRARGKPLGVFLLTRGVWLLVLEVTLVGFGFNFKLPFVMLQVIWAIGFGMVALAALHRLPLYVLAALACLIICGHDALTLMPYDGVAWKLLFTRGEVTETIWVGYAGVPWLGVMLLGYVLGPWFVRDDRRKRLAVTGALMVAAFVAVRWLNIYGDPKPWAARASFGRTVLSFLEVSKYPPSLCYVLVTVGIALLLFSALERMRGPLLAFGRAPMFTYLLHLYFVHGGALIVGVLCGYPASIFIDMLNDPDRAVAAHWGFGLPLVYLAWITIVLLLYPLSRWFAGVKRARRDWWLSYL